MSHNTYFTTQKWGVVNTEALQGLFMYNVLHIKIRVISIPPANCGNIFPKTRRNPNDIRNSVAILKDNRSFYKLESHESILPQ